MEEKTHFTKPFPEFHMCAVVHMPTLTHTHRMHTHTHTIIIKVKMFYLGRGQALPSLGLVYSFVRKKTET